MTFSIRKTIRALAAPEHRLSSSARLWREGLEELRRRGHGRHESGAFLLGRHSSGERRRIERFVYYDDLDPHSLDTGIVVFDGAGYGPLWKICRESGLEVVADVHTHEYAPRQSLADRANPMIATRGHIALIVPGFAERVFLPGELGIYQYEGEHRWHEQSGVGAGRFFYVGFWG
jgi:proteasome lid subunit RPN8/RPN11